MLMVAFELAGIAAHLECVDRAPNRNFLNHSAGVFPREPMLDAWAMMPHERGPSLSGVVFSGRSQCLFSKSETRCRWQPLFVVLWCLPGVEVTKNTLRIVLLV